MELWAPLSAVHYCLNLSFCNDDRRCPMLKLEMPTSEGVLAWSRPTWAALQSLDEECSFGNPTSNSRTGGCAFDFQLESES